jgi:hypothetical protein
LATSVWRVRIRALAIAIAALLPGSVVVQAAETAPFDPGPPSLMLAAQSRIRRDDVRSLSPSPPALRLDFAAAFPRSASSRGLSYPARTWPLALGAAADAATTSWALGRGACERNPLLTTGRFDVLMVKMVQLPLLLGAIENVEAKNPRLGRRLRWASVAFHALLAVNNLRGGASGRVAAAAATVTRP